MLTLWLHRAKWGGWLPSLRTTDPNCHLGPYLSDVFSVFEKSKLIGFMLSFDTWLITFRQLMLTSVTASCCVFLFRFVQLLLTWVTYKFVAYKWQRQWLNHYNRSAVTSRTAKEAWESIKCNPKCNSNEPSLCFLLKSDDSAFDTFLFITYLRQLRWYELAVPVVIWRDTESFLNGKIPV